MNKKIEDHWIALVKYFRNHRVNRWDAEELAQDVFYKVLHCNVDNDYMFKLPYLYGVARNVLIDYHRSRHVQYQHLSTSVDGSSDLNFPELVDEITPDDDYQGSALGEKLQHCLANMPAMRQAVMSKYLFEMHSQKSLGKLFSVTEKTIQKHISLGKQQLSELAA